MAAFGFVSSLAPIVKMLRSAARSGEMHRTRNSTCRSGIELMRFSKESPVPNSPRIEVAMPDAALPGGEIEVRGTQLGAVRFRQPVAVLDGIVAPVLLSRSNRMIVRIPRMCKAGDLRSGRMGNPAIRCVSKLRALSPEICIRSAIRQWMRGQHLLYGFRSTGAKNASLGLPHHAGRRDAAPGERDYECYGPGTRRPGLPLRLLPAGWHGPSRLSPGRVFGVRRGDGYRDRDCVRFRGHLYVGDRSGTIFQNCPGPADFRLCHARTQYCRLPSCFWPGWNALCDGSEHLQLRLDLCHRSRGRGARLLPGPGPPQGLAFDVAGNLYVSGSFHGTRGIVCITPAGEASVVLAGSGIVGLAFVPGGNAILAANGAV